MNIKTKIIIFFAALLISLIGFNAIATPAIDILKIGKQAGDEIIANYLAKVEAASQQSSAIKG